MRSVRIIWLYVKFLRRGKLRVTLSSCFIKLYAWTTATQGYLLRIIYKRCFCFRSLRTVFFSSIAIYIAFSQHTRFPLVIVHKRFNNIEASFSNPNSRDFHSVLALLAYCSIYCSEYNFPTMH